MDPKSQISDVSDPDSFGTLPPVDGDLFSQTPQDFSSEITQWATQPNELDALTADFHVLRQDQDETRKLCETYDARFATIQQELESLRCGPSPLFRTLRLITSDFYSKRLHRFETRQQKPRVQPLHDTWSTSTPAPLHSPGPISPLPRNNQAPPITPVFAPPITTKHGIRFSAEVYVNSQFSNIAQATNDFHRRSRTSAPTESSTQPPSTAGPSESTSHSCSVTMSMSVGLEIDQIQKDSNKAPKFHSSKADNPGMLQNVQRYIKDLNKGTLQNLVIDLIGLVLDIRIVVPSDKESTKPSISMALLESGKQNPPETPLSAKSPIGIKTPSRTASPHTPLVRSSVLLTPASGPASLRPMSHPSAPVQAPSEALRQHALSTPTRAAVPPTNMAASQQAARNTRLYAGSRPQMQLQPPSHPPIPAGYAPPASGVPAQLAGQKRKAVAQDVAPQASAPMAAVAPPSHPPITTISPQQLLQQQWMNNGMQNTSNAAPPQQFMNNHNAAQYLSLPSTNLASPYDGRPAKRQRSDQNVYGWPPGPDMS